MACPSRAHVLECVSQQSMLGINGAQRSLRCRPGKGLMGVLLGSRLTLLRGCYRGAGLAFLSSASCHPLNLTATCTTVTPPMVRLFPELGRDQHCALHPPEPQSKCTSFFFFFNRVRVTDEEYITQHSSARQAGR